MLLIRILAGFTKCFFVIYIIEYYPTSVRHYAFGFMMGWSYLIIFLLLLINKILIDVKLNPFAILGVLYIFGIFMLPKLKETF